jgi:hypothetical protein
MRDAPATVVLAYVLGLRESSVMSRTTRAQNITHTVTKEGVSEGIKNAVQATHAVEATYAPARTGVVTYLPSHSDGSIAQVRLALRTDLQRMY